MLQNFFGVFFSLGVENKMDRKTRKRQEPRNTIWLWTLNIAIEKKDIKMHITRT